MKPLFREIQRAPKPLYILTGAVFAFTVLITLVIYLAQVTSSRSVDLMDTVLMVSFTVLLPAGVLLWMLLVKQEVVIDHDGISVQQHGLMRKPKTFNISEIREMNVRTLNAFGEFGGWGIRYAFNGKWGYIMDGSSGIDLSMTNGKRYVVSVVDSHSAEQAIEKIRSN